MIRRPPRSTRTYTLFPYTTLFRSKKLDELESFEDETLNIAYSALGAVTLPLVKTYSNIRFVSSDGYTFYYCNEKEVWTDGDMEFELYEGFPKDDITSLPIEGTFEVLQ